MSRRFALLALAVTSPLAAQPHGSVGGTITDSSTGQPVVRGAAWLGSRHRLVDSLGRFVFDSVAPGRYLLSVQCASGTVLGFTRPIWQGDVEITAGQSITRAFRVGSSNCDQRPLLTVAGEFRGFYESGFEHSRFIPCPVPIVEQPSLLSAIDKPEIWVWAQFRPGATRRPWPHGDETRGIRRWYVRWRGTIRGPDRYGHLRGAQYEATVDTLLTIRYPNGTDCA